VDELHTVIGAGAAEGAIDASNMLKPALGRGERQCIGATTLDEYRKYIEHDAALERSSQPITADPPSVDDTLEVLEGMRESYETAASWRDKANEISKQLEETKKKWREKRDLTVPMSSAEDIANVVSKWTGVPVNRLTETETEKLMHMEEGLHKRIIGQEEAIK